jgi:hypothetical protein
MTLHVRISQLTVCPTAKRACALHVRHANHDSVLPLTCRDNGSVHLMSDSVFTCPLSAPGFLDFALTDESSNLAHLRLPVAWLPRNCVMREAFHMQPLTCDLSNPILFLDVHYDDNSAGPFTAPLAPSVPTRRRVPKFGDLGQPSATDWEVVLMHEVADYARQLDGFNPDIPAREYRSVEMEGLHVLEDFSFFPSNDMTAARYLEATSMPVVVEWSDS